MARLLKKKTASDRKKSKQDNDIPVIPQESNNGSKKAILNPDSLSEAKKVQSIQQKKPLTGIKSVTEKESNNYYQRALQFLREVKIELKKVTWPSRKQTVGSTVVVIILVMIISLFLGVVDIGLSSLVRVVLQ
jgi:preprotein translocase subunit SecE